MLHVRHLPDFGGTLRAADVELLLSYLLAPYLRVLLRVEKGRPPCLTTPPQRPPWTICRLGPPLRTPERRLSRSEARRGL